MSEPRHEPSTCEVLFCPFCTGWREGYDFGKRKAVEEVHDRLEEIHMDGCGCTPCLVVRDVSEKIYKVVFSPNEPTLWGMPPFSGGLPEDDMASVPLDDSDKTGRE